MPRVLNKRWEQPTANTVYVGRPTIWGNPHRVGWCSLCGKAHEQGEAAALYEGSMSEALKQRAREELRGKDLMCWCAPKACHAETLLRIANAEEF